MAQLFRFLFTDDRHRSEVFTFMIPSSFILDSETDLKSRDFTSSNQKWSLSFSKVNGTHLSTYLTLKSAYEGMQVTADYGITLINREHFTRNENFTEKGAKFSFETPAQGRKAFVSIETLCTLDFMDERGNIQCELEIKNVNTTFSYDTQIPPQPSQNSYVRSTSDLKYVSGTFAFGNYEWNICIQPKLDQTGAVSCLKFYLCRLSSLDHLCRVGYRYKLINGAFVHDSGYVEQYSDVNGTSNSVRMDKARELLQVSGKFVVRLELIKVNSVFPILLYPLAEEPQAVQFYDRDRQAWMMESCIEDNCFVLRLFYTDINNIPSGYVRVLSFNIAVRHAQMGSVYVFKKPVIKYYYKREADDGLEITTTIDASEMTMENNGYLDQDGGITVEMEWYYSHLLHQPEYSHLDDIIRKQKLQMLREIQTLQQENYSLEKQLHMAGGPTASPQQQQQAANNLQQQQQGPRTKSFDNPSASSTASSGVGTSISSLNATNTNLAGLNSNAAGAMNTNTPPTPNVVKKYYEQKYGSTTNMTGGNSAMGVGGGGGGGGPGPGGANNMMGGGSTPNDKMMIPPSSRNGAPRNYGQTPQQQQQQSGMNPNVTTSHINMNFGGGPNQQPNNSPGGIGGVAGGFLNNMNNNPNNPLGAQLSSLTSQFTSGIANLKLTASNSGIANKFTSKFMNPFSS